MLVMLRVKLVCACDVWFKAPDPDHDKAGTGDEWITVHMAQMKEFKQKWFCTFTLLHLSLVGGYSCLIMFSNLISTTAVTWSNACKCPVHVGVPLCSALPSHRPIFPMHTVTDERDLTHRPRASCLAVLYYSGTAAECTELLYCAIGISTIWHCGINGLHLDSDINTLEVGAETDLYSSHCFPRWCFPYQNRLKGECVWNGSRIADWAR